MIDIGILRYSIDNQNVEQKYPNINNITSAFSGLKI